MTVTQRRNRPAADAPEQQSRGTLEPGIKVTCDFCHNDITNTVRFKCANEECRDLDICPLCFTEGKAPEGQPHRPWHDYMVEEPLTTPIFDPDWGADEEILLVSGLITYGLGNWLEVAAHIGTRTKEECETHYCQTYLGCTPEGKPYDREKDVVIEASVEAVGSKPGPEGIDGIQEGNGVFEEKTDEERDLKRKREFMPPMSKHIEIILSDWQARKKARIEEMRKPIALPPPTGALVSAPTNHEVGGYMPGRLEFEHEVENDAEVAVKDMEFGLVWKYGGDEQPACKVVPPIADEDEEEEEEEEEEDGDGDENGNAKDKDVKPDIKADKEAKEAKPSIEVKQEPVDDEDKKKNKQKAKSKSASPDLETEEPSPDEIEDEGELEVKLALLDIYFSKLDKREEAKELIFDRGLTEVKELKKADQKRAKDERELLNRYKVFAKLQTAMDFEVLTEGLVYEQQLKRRIAELQEYRRMGITTGAEADDYESRKAARAGYRPIAPLKDKSDPVLSGARVNAGQNRFLQGMASTPPPQGGKIGAGEHGRIPGGPGRRPPAPLNLANSQSLDLLSTEEQHLCSALRVLPKPYLSIKELYIRENDRRHGGLKRRDARKMLKIDVNKSGRIFDFLVAHGMLRLSYDPTVTAPPPPTASITINGNLQSRPPMGSNLSNVSSTTVGSAGMQKGGLMNGAGKDGTFSSPAR